MTEYNITKSEKIDADQMLKKITSLNDLLKIELITDSDNILLMRRGLELISEELGKLNNLVRKMQ